VSRLNVTRHAVLRDVAGVRRAVATLDSVDARALRGTAPPVEAARRPAGRAERTAARALGRMGGDVRAYGQALAALRAATTGLPAAPGSVLRAITSAGLAERATLAGYADLLRRRVWPAYRALAAAAFTWADHATWGWFASRRQAAGAYVVARPASIQRARRLLAAADAGRVRADTAMAAALRRARSLSPAR